MDLPGKTKYSLLGFTLVFTLLFKYPSEPHESGKDSFIVHSLAQYLQDLHFAPWLVHPLSAYAMYPFSYAPGMSFILASLSNLTGLSIELSILLFSVIISFVGAYGMFMFTGEISDRFDVKFVASFLFVFTPTLSTFLIWTISTRGPFICLMTLLLWAFGRTINARHKGRFFLVALIFLLILPTIHRFALILPIVLLALLASYLSILGLEFTDRASIYYRENVMIVSAIIFAFMLFLFYLQVAAVDIYAPSMDYFSVWFAYGGRDSPLTLAINILVYYGMSMGILMLFGGLGLASVLGNVNKTRMEWSLLYLIVFFALFLMDRTYLKMFVAPLFLPLLAIGLVAVMDKIEYRKDLYTILFASLLLIAAYHGSFATRQHSEVLAVEEMGYHHHMDEGPYNTAIYIRDTMYTPRGPVAIHNDFVDRQRIGGVSGMPMIHLSEGQALVAYPNLTERVTIRQKSFFDMYLEAHDRRYYVDWAESEVKREDNYHTIIGLPWTRPELESLLQEGRVQWAVVYTFFPDDSGSSSHPFRNSRSWFFRSLPDHRYSIYENDHERIYFLLPVE